MAAVLAYLGVGEGALAEIELRSLIDQSVGAADPPFTKLESHYWLGLAYFHALEWGRANAELRAYLAGEVSSWRAGWAFLLLGRAYESSGRTDEASLAYRGCLGAEGAERQAKKLAFDLMSRLAGSLPMGYGQATSRPAQDHR